MQVSIKSGPLKTLALLCALIPGVALAAIDKVVVFGDSLSDNGNLAIITAGTSTGDALLDFPYANGRVTNGSVAVEWMNRFLGLPDLTASLSGGTNYAVAGATARRTGDTAADIISLRSQVLQHIQSEGSLSTNTLYAIVIGGNDLRDARSAPTNAAARSISTDTARAISQSIAALSLAGARKFIVTNGPDIGLIPETRLLAAAAGIPTLPRTARVRTRVYNRILLRTLARLNQRIPGDIVHYNLFGVLNTIVRFAPGNGFTVTNRPCFISSGGVLNYDRACNNGANLNSFLFFDPIHPSASAHRIVGRSMFRKIPASFRQ